MSNKILSLTDLEEFEALGQPAALAKEDLQEFEQVGPSRTEAVIRGAAQGLTLGFADELMARLRHFTHGTSYSIDTIAQEQLDAPIPGAPALAQPSQSVAGMPASALEFDKDRKFPAAPPKPLQHFIDEERAKDAEAREAHPWSFATAQIAGGVIPAGLALKAGALPGLATVGALHGWGQSEKHALRDALIGGAVGGAAGTAGMIPKALAKTPIGRSLTKNIGEQLSKSVSTGFKEGLRSIPTKVSAVTPEMVKAGTKAAASAAHQIVSKAAPTDLVRAVGSDAVREVWMQTSGVRHTAREYSAILGQQLTKDGAEDALEAVSSRPVDRIEKVQNELVSAIEPILEKKDVKRASNAMTMLSIAVDPYFAEGILTDPQAFLQPPDEAILQDLDVAAEALATEGVQALLTGKSVAKDNPIKQAQDAMIRTHKQYFTPFSDLNALNEIIGKGTVKEQYDKMVDRVSELSSNPSVMAVLLPEESMALAPTLADKYNLQLLHVIKHMEEILPKKRTQSPLFGRSYVPSDQEWSRFKSRMDAILYPASVFARLEQGKAVNQAQMETIEALYPALLPIFRERLIKKASEKKNITYADRLRISRLLGQAADASVTPQVLQQLQANFQPQEPQQVSGPARPAQFNATDQKAGGAQELLKAR